MESADMATNQTLIARWNGEIVGNRKTPRDYIHAIIGHRNEATARAKAYDMQPNKADEADFKYFEKRAAREAGVPFTVDATRCIKPWSYEQTLTAEDIAEAKAKIEGGFDGYMARQRDRAIERFEEDVKGGAFRPYVLAWSQSDRAAQAAVQKWRNDGYVVLGLAPAEVQQKKARAA